MLLFDNGGLHLAIIRSCVVMKDFMIDIETLGTRPGSVIASIAIVPFDPYVGEVGSEMFFCTINTRGQVEYGLHQEEGTVAWWLSQDDDVREVSFPSKPNFDDLQAALDAVSDYMKTIPDAKVWSHGSSFDTVLLSEAFARCGLNVPWRYQNVRDTRTILGFCKENGFDFVVENPMKHDPRADAISQAKMICSAYALMRFR